MRTASVTRNRLLRRLPSAEAALLRPLLERHDLPSGSLVCDAGDAVLFAVFPETGVISLRASAAPGFEIEVALLGHEGMFGLSLPFGSAVSTLAAVAQSAATVQRVDHGAFRAVLGHCPTLAFRLRRYAYGLMTQVAQTAACNSAHSIEARTARWMLVMSDRVDPGAFRTTQAQMARMLGVQRSAVSIAASALSKAGLVRYSRGAVEVLDRGGLEACACDCYAALDAIYRDALR